MQHVAYLARMSSSRTSAPLDWLVVTAANRRQAEAYEMRITERVTSGALPAGCRMLVVADACDARIGSGAATVLALVEVARKLVTIKSEAIRTKSIRDGRSLKSLNDIFAGSTTQNLVNLFAETRILMLHSGGDSRRLPMYAVEGKLFATLPMRAPGFRCGAMFDLLVDDLLSLPPRAGGELLVAAGDAVLGIRQTPIRIDGPGVVGVAQRADEVRARRHGVFVLRRGESEVQAFLQKPTHDDLVAAGALAKDGTALVDTGLLSFDARAIAALLAASGVTLERGAVQMRRGGLAERASRAAIPPVDLYREILCALPRLASREAYLDMVGAPLSAVLAPFFDAMRTTAFRAQVASVGEFLHIGSMREMLDALVGPRAAIARFGVRAESHPIAPKSTVGSGDALVLDSALESLRVRTGRAVLDAVPRCRFDLGGENIVTSLHPAWTSPRIQLPHGVCLFSIPVKTSEVHGVVFVTCGIDDDFKTPLDRGGTIFGTSFADFARRARLSSMSRNSGALHTLWDEPLWCVAPVRDPLVRVSWMWKGQAAPAAWKKARRYSMRELLEIADASESLAWREGAVDFAHRAAPDMAVSAFPNPITRARVAAKLAQSKSLVIEPELRARAFREIGDAVLAQHEPLLRPIPAAILHDQAVWTSMPVRVDLAGGWSDTPPICNEVGGSVVNVALMLRGQLPIQVVAKLEEPRRGEQPVIRITSTDLGDTRVITETTDLAERGDPTRWSSLAENALVLTGVAPADPRKPLRKWLKTVGGSVSLTMFSAVPKGSGLGTSSILGAATIHCLDRVFGRERSPKELFAATSALEQMLSTRGGWQDQVGGVLGGFKIARTTPGALQLPEVERIAVPQALSAELASRALLYFTGERRMAKNILENVVWNWLLQVPSAVDAVERLQSNAERMRISLAEGSLEAILTELTEYTRCKRQIDPGSCPRSFDELASRWKRELSAWSFAGAGGGGFMVLVAKSAAHAETLRERIRRDPPHPRARAFDFEVDAVGLRCAVL
jgi:fucokinase